MAEFFQGAGSVGLMIGAIVWGILHGLTPHGHSWLVLLPFALGGMNTRGMLRMALAYCGGMVVTAAATGALLGLIVSSIPERWHHGVELGVGILLLIIGLVFIVRPLSAHHAIDHICHEECQSGEERALLRAGTMGAMFMLGVMSMLIPCPTNLPMYAALTAGSRTPWDGAAFFTVYALFTSASIIFVALAMVRARSLIALIEQRGYRTVIWRISGFIILAAAGWLIWLGTHEHDHGHHGHGHQHAPAIHQEIHDHGHDDGVCEEHDHDGTIPSHE